MLALWIALLSVIASGAGQLLLRQGAIAIPPLSPATIANPHTWLVLMLNGWVLAGVAAWAIATLLWIVVLNRAPLGHVYMLGSLNYIVVPLLSRWLFAEHLSRLQMVGMLVIVVGVVLTLVGRSNATLP